MTRRRSIEGAGELFLAETDNVSQRAPAAAASDSLQRENAVGTTISCIVEAPAGSGKTGLLIQRYLKLLTLSEVELPEQVLAITFTIKAAGEIRERIVDHLELAATTTIEHLTGFAGEIARLAAKVLERDRQMGWGLLEQPRRMNLRTIDSICAEIARGMPILSGGSALTPVEDSSVLHKLAAERTLLQLGGSNRRLSDALSIALLHRDGDLQRCQDLLAEMLALRDQWGRLVPLDRQSLEEETLDRHVLPKLEAALAAAICEELEAVHRSFPSRALERLTRLLDEMSAQPGYQGKSSPINFCLGKTTAPCALIEDLPTWRALADLLTTKQDKWRSGFNSNHVGFEITKEQRSALKDVLEELKPDTCTLDLLSRVKLIPPASYPAQQWRVAKALFVVLHFALIELQLVFAEQGECDFTELGLLARSALQNENGAIDTALGAKLQHILVDEMQDTSTSQYELIELLTQGWDGRSQTVFLVGDPKQSIYLFRQARVERFIQMMNEHRIGTIPLELLQLRSNFRSRPELVEDFNETFERIFPSALDPNNQNEAPYIAAEPSRPSTLPGSPGTIWHPQVIESAEQAETMQGAAFFARSEAESVRQIIESWRGRPLPGDKKSRSIAVLVRNRRHLAHIVAELKNNRGTGPIPFRAINIEPLAERREVLDLFALTRALLHPADRIAWLAVLRAPWCGLELADIHILCGQDDPIWQAHTVMELLSERTELLSRSAQKRLAHVVPILWSATTQFARMPSSELVERTWKTLGGHSYLAVEERKNAEQFLSLLCELDQQGLPLHPEILQRALQQLYAAPSNHPDAVDLITIHGAKGLEWDVVLVPGLERRSHSDSQRLLVWDEINRSEQDESSVLLAPIIGKGADDVALNRWLSRLHRRREEAECKRLFYVACTRAREELHLFATLTRRKDGSLRPGTGTLLGAAWPAAEEHFVDTSAKAKPLIAPVLSFPQYDQNPVLTSIAATAEKKPSFASLHRLPLITPEGAMNSPSTTRPVRVPSLPGTYFERPEGSFEVRAFGSTVHALLELLARRLSSGAAVQELVSETAAWQSRIDSLLRSHGLSPAAVQRYAPLVRQALQNTLADPEGQWILGAHKDAQSEHSLVRWDQERFSIRLDRIFRAGSSPSSSEADHLWVVDFKTTSHRGADLDTFLKEEQRKYSAQMETYASVLRASKTNAGILLGLYYPLLPKLIWWASDKA